MTAMYVTAQSDDVGVRPAAQGSLKTGCAPLLSCPPILEGPCSSTKLVKVRGKIRESFIMPQILILLRLWHNRTSSGLGRYLVI